MTKKICIHTLWVLVFTTVSAVMSVSAQKLPAGQVSAAWSGDAMASPTLSESASRLTGGGNLRRNNGVYGFGDEDYDTTVTISLPQLTHVDGNPALCSAFVGGFAFRPNNIYYMSWFPVESAGRSQIRIVNGYASDKDDGVPLDIGGVAVTGIGIEAWSSLPTLERIPFEVGVTTQLVIEEFTVNFRGPVTSNNGKGKVKIESLATCEYLDLPQPEVTFGVYRYF